jgi:hypothetical protein
VTRRPALPVATATPGGGRRTAGSLGSRRERGAAGLFVAVLAPFLIALAGLVFDGGRALEARQRALDAAEQAARDAANQCDTAILRSRSECVVDPSRVDAAVAKYLVGGVQLDGRPGIENGGRTVMVKTKISVDTIFLGLFAVDRLDLEVDARRATAVTGLA